MSLSATSAIYKSSRLNCSKDDISDIDSDYHVSEVIGEDHVNNEETDDDLLQSEEEDFSSSDNNESSSDEDEGSDEESSEDSTSQLTQARDKVKELTFHLHILEEKLAFAKQETGKITSSMEEQRSRFEEQLKLIQAKLTEMERDGLCEQCGGKKIKQSLEPLLEEDDAEEENEEQQQQAGDEEWEPGASQDGGGKGKMSSSVQQLELESAKKKILELETELSSMASTKSSDGPDKDQLISDQGKTVENLNSENVSLKEDVAKFEKELAIKKEESDVKFSVLAKQLEDSQNEASSYKEEVASLQSKLTSLEQQTDQLKSNVECGKEDMSKLEELRAESKNCDLKMKSLEESLSNMALDMEVKEKEFCSKMDEKEQLIAELNKKLANSETMTSRIAELNETVASKAKENHEIQEEIKSYKENLELLEKEKSNQITLTQELKEIISTKEDEITLLKKELEVFKNKQNLSLQKESQLLDKTEQTDMLIEKCEDKDIEKLKHELESKKHLEKAILQLSDKIKGVEEQLLEESQQDKDLSEKAKQVLDLNSKIEMLIRAASQRAEWTQCERKDDLQLEIESFREKDLHSSSLITNLTERIRLLEQDLAGKEQLEDQFLEFQAKIREMERNVVEKNAAIEEQNNVIISLESDLDANPRGECVAEMESKMALLQNQLEEEKENSKSIQKEMVSCQMERDSHKRLIKELNTWARDLKETLLETERDKERDKVNYQAMMDSLKADYDKEREEIRFKMEALNSDILSLAEANNLVIARNKKLKRDRDKVVNEKVPAFREEVKGKMEAVLEAAEDINQLGLGLENLAGIAQLKNTIEQGNGVSKLKEIDTMLKKFFDELGTHDTTGLDDTARMNGLDGGLGEQLQMNHEGARRDSAKPPIPLPVRSKVGRAISESGGFNPDMIVVRRLDRDPSMDRQSTTSKDSSGQIKGMKKSRGLFGSLRKLGRSISVDRQDFNESGSDISNFSQSSKVSISSCISNSAKQLVHRAKNVVRDASLERQKSKKDEDTPTKISGGRRQKSGPFGPLGNTGAAFLKYFERPGGQNKQGEKGEEEITYVSEPSPAPGTPPVNRRLPMPEPD